MGLEIKICVLVCKKQAMYEGNEINPYEKNGCSCDKETAAAMNE